MSTPKSQQPQIQDDLAFVLEKLFKAKNQPKFFGKVTVVFEEGEVRRVVVEESMMPPKKT